MTTAAELIAALNQKRKRLSLRPEMAGQLPPGWQRWLDDMPVLDVAAASAKPQPWVDAFLQRPLRAIPRRSAMLGRWQAAMRLLQQEWDPDPRDERGLRIGVGVVDILLHLLLVALLIWLVYLGFMATAQPQQEDEAVQVEFIGRGNVAEGGGAIANAGAESAPADAAPATRASTPAPATGRPDAPIKSEAAPSPPQAAASNAAPLERETSPPAVAEAAQVLQVTETAAPEPRAFQLPPPKPRDTPQPQLQVREVQPRQQVEEIAILRTQPQRALQPREPLAEVRVPQLQQAPQELQVPVPQRLATPRARATPSRVTSTAQIQVPQLRGEVRDIPMPPGGAPTPAQRAGSGTASQTTASAPGAGGERGTAPAAGQSQAGTGQGARPAEQGGRGVTAAGSGAGPAKPAPGGWPGAAKTDDWGASKRNVAGTGNGSGKDAGGKPGLFNEDGSARLSDEWTQQSGVDIDRAGTWLKRPGLEYRGTRFDRYWIPNGTLLEEWVRKGIKQVAIPIPGSRRQLRCVVSILPPGAICNPYSPDVNEQPARARPPPDIPFKPELQEDNGSVRPIP